MRHNIVNPFTLIFMDTFRVQNKSAQPVRIWVLHRNEYGTLSPVRQYASASLALPAFRQGGFRLQPREEITISYDWEKSHLNLILVEGKDGTFAGVPADDSQTLHQTEVYVIPPLRQLRPALGQEAAVAVMDPDISPEWVVLGPGLLASRSAGVFLPSSAPDPETQPQARQLSRKARCWHPLRKRPKLEMARCRCRYCPKPIHRYFPVPLQRLRQEPA